MIVGTVFGGDAGRNFVARPWSEHFNHSGGTVAAEIWALRAAIHPGFGKVQQLGRIAVGIAERHIIDGESERGRAEEKRVGLSPHRDDLAEAS